MNGFKRRILVYFLCLIVFNFNESLFSTSPRIYWGGWFDISTDNSIIAADETLLVTATVTSIKRDTVFVGLGSFQPFETIGDSIVRVLLDSGISASVSFQVKLRPENMPVGEMRHNLRIGVARSDPRESEYFIEKKMLPYIETKEVQIAIRDPDEVAETNPIVWEKLAITELPFYEITFHKSGIWFGSARDALYKSTTNGKTWKITLPPGSYGDILPFPRIYCLPSGVILLLAKDYVLRSTDIGSSWQPIASMKEKYWGSGFYSASDGTVFALGITSKSTDDGITWKEPNKGIKHIHSTEIIEPRPGRLLIVGYPSRGYSYKNPNSGIYVSDDFGNSWIPTSIKKTIISSIAHSGELFAWGYKDGMDDMDKKKDAGIFSHSRDGGKTWAYSTYGLPRRRTLSSLTLAPDGHLLTTAESGDLYRTTEVFISQPK